jgi:hypothetical protein
MSPHISFRMACLADVQNLAALTIQVWLHTYAKDGVHHDISAYVLIEFTPKKFAALNNNPRVNSNNIRAISFYVHQAFVQHGVTYFEFGGNQYENKVLVKHLKAVDIKQM